MQLISGSNDASLLTMAQVTLCRHFERRVMNAWLHGVYHNAMFLLMA